MTAILASLCLMPRDLAPVLLFEIEGHPMYKPVCDPLSRNIAWEYNARTYLLKFDSREVIQLGAGSTERNQVDSGLGLISIWSNYGGGRRVTETFRLSDGIKVGEVAGFRERVGNMFIGDEYVDLNGRLLLKPSRGWSKDPPANYFGRLIWNGKRRLAIIGQGDKPSDTKDVVEINSGWKKGKRAYLSDYAMGFDRIVGNPDTGAFAVYERSPRTSQATGVFSKDLRRIGGDMLSVSDIGPYGVLATILKPNPVDGMDFIPGESMCMDPETGRTKWTSPSPGVWLGANVLQDRQILSGKTGKPIGRLLLPKVAKGIIKLDEDILYVSLGSPRVGVYRLTP